MGVDVVLKKVGRAGTSPKRRRLAQVGVVVDSDDLFARICQSSTQPMLSRVDPYGDLVVTGSEMPQLLAELDIELGRTKAGLERDLLATIRALAEQCAADEELELHLEGD